MTPRKQPDSLLYTCRKLITTNILEMCERIVSYSNTSAFKSALERVMNVMRPYYHRKLPPVERMLLLNDMLDTIRYQYLNEGLGDQKGKIMVVLLMLLFDRSVKNLSLFLCCYYECTEERVIFQLLAKYGSGLEDLSFYRQSLLKLNVQHFSSVLMSTNNLHSLSLRNICNNYILPVISKNCQVLTHLDITNSSIVDDTGIKNMISILQKQKSNSRNLSHTLHTFKIMGTAITCHGILNIISHMPNIQSLGYAENVLDALLIQAGIKSDPIKLNCLSGTQITSVEMQKIIRLCPNLDTVLVSNPIFLYENNNHAYLTNLQHLKRLGLYHIQRAQDVANNLFKADNENNTVSKLTLVYKQNSNAVIDLASILTSFPKLNYLECEDAAFVKLFQMPSNTGISCNFKYLRYIHLGNSVHINVLQTILHQAVHLQVLHVRSSSITNENIMDILHKTVLPSLVCFYIYCAPNLTTDIVYHIIENYQGVIKIGNLSRWGKGINENELRKSLSRDNYDVTFESGSHWHNPRYKSDQYHSM